MVAKSPKKSKAQQANQLIVIEISQAHVTLVTCENVAEDEQPPIVWRTVNWRSQSGSLLAEDGKQELVDVLSKLAQQENLQNCPVHVALSSDFCVTRVVSGENEQVDRELQSLGERSALYLSLGTGTKLHTSSSVPVDAKRRTAWMTVVNGRVLDTICSAIEQAGMSVEWVEHSLISLCRAVGRVGHDSDSPVLIVDVRARGIDLGVCYQGRLLLDYRPGGAKAKECVAETILHHLKRIQRYCNRNFHFNDGKISRVYICGNRSEIAPVAQAFANQNVLTAQSLEVDTLNTNLDLSGDLPSELGPSLGLLIALRNKGTNRHSPNLVAPLVDARRGPILPELLKHGWPIGVAMLLTVLMWIVNTYSNWTVSQLKSEKETLQSEAGKVHMMQLKVMEANAKLRQSEFLKSKLFNPRVRDILEVVAGCTPESAWLVEIRIDRDGAMVIAGKVRKEGDIYEFVDHLKKAPGFDEVALEGTRPERLQHEVITYFEVKCKYHAQVDHSKSKESNG